MGRTGSIVKLACDGVFSTTCDGAFSTACAGFFAATRTGFSAVGRAGFVSSFLVFLDIDGSVFAVITCTASFVISLLPLSPPNEDGAKLWARAPALNVTETNAAASAKKIRGLRTSARYAGNHKPRQAFFFDKNRWRMGAYERPFSAFREITILGASQSPGKYSGPYPGGGPNVCSRSM